jgi:predicted helicase
VFDALFAHDSFAAHNPVSQTMQAMVSALDGHGLAAETTKLDGFYASVRRRAEGIVTPEGRQTVIADLYEQFFKEAFPKQSSSLGVVYTPVEIVDFILRAADDVCRTEPPRRVRRAGSLEGSLSWHDPASTRPNCVSALSGL